MIVLPEDIERLIAQSVAWNAESKQSVIALSWVAPRFYQWMKPILYHTIVIPSHSPLLENLLPNAKYIRTLVINQAYRQDLKLVVGSCTNIRNLGVSWDVWESLAKECGSIPLESLYLMWNPKYWESNIPSPSLPSLKSIQHPHLLKELTIYAPADVQNSTPFRQWGSLYIDRVYLKEAFTNLARITYICDRPPIPLTCLLQDVKSLETLVFIQIEVDVPWDEDWMEKDRKDNYPKFFDLYLPSNEDVLEEWIKRGEERISLWDRLEHRSLSLEPVEEPY